jgi:hypothetical protein
MSNKADKSFYLLANQSHLSLSTKKLESLQKRLFTSAFCGGGGTGSDCVVSRLSANHHSRNLNVKIEIGSISFE